MMIGPLPISRIVSMSFLRGTSAGPHELRELLEEIARVVRTGPRFRVVLHAERAEMLTPDALDVAVVQIQVRDDAALRKRVGVDGVVVVLTRDLDATRREVPHGMVAAVVAEAQLEGLRAEGEAHDL